MPLAVGFDCSVIISQIRRLWMSGRRTFPYLENGRFARQNEAAGAADAAA
jgi:hypothetical protein